MKTMLKKLRKMWIAGALLGLAACDEPYQQPVNENAQPAIILVSFRDAVSFNGDGTLPEGGAFNLDVGPADVLVPPDASKTGESTNAGPLYGTITVDGTEANPPATISIPPSESVVPGNGNGSGLIASAARNALIYPFQAPRLEFNKLMNGDTIEETATDQSTNKQLGHCVMLPGAITMNYVTPAISGSEPTLQACYSPSDRLITATAADDATDSATPNPKDFLQYSAQYTLTTSSSIKDKQNKSLTEFTLSFTTSPFELLLVTDASGSAIQWAASDTGLSAGACATDADCAGLEGCAPPNDDKIRLCEDGSSCTADADCAHLAVCEPSGICSDTANLIDDTAGAPPVIRLVFSGPVGALTSAATAADIPGAAPADAGATVYMVDAAGVETPVTDASGNPPQFAQETPDEVTHKTGPDISDPRVLFIYYPDYYNFVSTSDTPASTAGFPAGHYRVHLPVTFTDNGSVTGTPVPLACADGSGGSSGTAATCAATGGVTFDFFIGPIPAR